MKVKKRFEVRDGNGFIKEGGYISERIDGYHIKDAHGKMHTPKTFGTLEDVRTYLELEAQRMHGLESSVEII